MALLAGGSSCFSPNREEGLTCSSEGLCPGSQVCDYDNVCRDSIANDARMVSSSDANSDASVSIDAAEIPDGAVEEPLFDLVPNGARQVSMPVGLDVFGSDFGPIECNEGQVMYGIEGDASSMGICRFKARCGQLEVSENEPVAALDMNGSTVPTGIGVGDCLSGAIGEALCPTGTVVSGIAGVSTGVALPKLTELILHCSPVSDEGLVLTPVDGEGIGGLGSPELMRESVSCGINRVAVGVQGTAESTLGSLNLICRRLVVVEE